MWFVKFFLGRIVVRLKRNAEKCRVLVWTVSLLACPSPDLLGLSRDRAVIGVDETFSGLLSTESPTPLIHPLDDLVQCSIYTADVNGQLDAHLTKEKPHWINARQFEISLRDNLTFSDGSPLTSQNIADTYENVRHKLRNLAKIEVIDARTVRFHLTEADAGFPSKLIFGIHRLQEHEFQGKNPNLQIGCGPYRVMSSDADRIILERNQFAPLNNQPFLHTIEIRRIKGESNRIDLLKRGALDLLPTDISLDSIRAAEQRYPQLRVLERTALETSVLGFNFRDKILAHTLVRTAIELAIDRDEIISMIFNGHATRASTILLPNMRFFPKIPISRTSNRQRAKTLLDQAGFPTKGEARFSLSIKTTSELLRVAEAKAIASQLKQIGINVQVEALEPNQFIAEAKAGKVQMWIKTWKNFTDPDVYRLAFGSDQSSFEGENWGSYINLKLDKLLKKGSQITEFNQRKKVYEEVQTILDEDVAAVFLWHPHRVALAQKSLKNFDIFADGRLTGLIQAFLSY